MSFNFVLEKTCQKTNARAATFETPHGTVKTPVFMPVGTNSAVKMLTNPQLKDVNSQIIFNRNLNYFNWISRVEIK